VDFLKEKLYPYYYAFRFTEELFNTDAHQQQFMSWYARYIGSVTDIPVTSLRVDVVSVHYNGSHLVTDSVYLFEQWETP
jgi:hypothetical protein